MTAADLFAAVWEALANFAADRILDLLTFLGPILFRLYVGEVPS